MANAWDTPVVYGQTASTGSNAQVTGSTSQAPNTTIMINGTPTAVYQNPSNGQYYQSTYSTPNIINSSNNGENSINDYLKTLAGNSSKSLLDQQQFYKDQIAAAEAKTATTAPVSNTTINWGEYKTPGISTFEATIAADPTLISYYQKVYAQAQGDVDEATRIMNYQYDTGVRRTVEDTAKVISQTSEDLASSLQSLGVTFGKEKNAAIDTLNKRGIMTTEKPGGGLNSGTEGQAGTEMSQLGEDQRLRQEAVQRNANRAVESAGLSKTRSLQDIEEKKTEANYSKGSNATQREQQIYQQKQQDILQRAQLAQSEKSASNAYDLQKKQYELAGGKI